MEGSSRAATVGGVPTATLSGEMRAMKDCQFMILIERQPEGKYLVSVPAATPRVIHCRTPGRWRPTRSGPIVPACSSTVSQSQRLDDYADAPAGII
jgi:hypothetical protein